MVAKLDLNLFTVFAVVYRHQSITLAAEELQVTQAAVSGSIKRLGQQCGQDIFIRDGRGIIATQYGHQLMRQLTPALDVMAGVLGNMQTFDCKNSQLNFTVLALENITNRIQPQAMELQQQGYPLITFKEEYSTEEPIEEALLRQQADLAIDISGSRHPSLQSAALYKEDAVVICRSAHSRIDGAVSLEQYMNEQHIRLNLTRAKLTAVDNFALTDVSGRKFVSECSSMLSLMALVAQSDCIGTSSRSLAEKYQKAFNLQILDLPFLFKPVQFSLVWHKRNNDNPAHIWLRTTIKSMFS